MRPRLFIRNLYGCPPPPLYPKIIEIIPPPNKKEETKNEEKMTAKHQRNVLNGPKQRIDIVCIADVAKESVLTTTTARETLGASKSGKISYFHTKYLLYWMVYQVKIAMFLYLVCKI